MSAGDDGTIRTDILLERLRQATLGDYEILAEAGRGGMAVVYLAHDLALDRKVAIKVISPDYLWLREDVAERFKREARVSASLSHPHIIPIYAVKEADNLLFFVMKYVQGRTLESVMDEVRPLPAAMVHTILVQIGSALAYAHRHGVVHRDIKPGNIMLDEEGWAVITDFGIAKIDAAEDLTRTGSAVGTPSYMSPEQCSGLPVSGASDQYALGVVAYEMLAGRRPFEASTAMALMYKHVHDRPEPIDVLVPDCPPGIARAVMRMLEKAPEKRWPQLENMISELGEVPPAASDEVRTRMLELARSGSARAIVQRFQTPASPVPRSRASMPRSPPADASGGSPSAGSEPADGAAAPPRERRRPAPTRVGRFAGFGWIWTTAPLAVVAAVLIVWAPWRSAATREADPVSPPGPQAPAAEPAALPPSVASVRVSPAERTLAVGETAALSVAAADGEDRPVDAGGAVWASLDPRVAAVGPDGSVTGLAPGTAEITATLGERVATARVTVRAAAAPPEPTAPRAAVASLSLTPASGNLALGESFRLQAVPLDGEGRALGDRPVTWSSSDEGVARVSTAGVVSGVGVGVARITATSEGRQQVATVVVAEAPAASLEVSPERQTLREGASVRLSAVVRDAQGRPLAGRPLRWASEDEGTARVSAEGEVTAVAAGATRVTVTSGEASGAVEIVVEAAPREAAADPRPALEAVVAAYARALEAQDVAEVRRLYPGIPAAQEERWTAFFANVRELGVAMTIRDLVVQGSEANADLEMTLTFRVATREVQTSAVRMTLREDGGTWRIVEIR